MYAAMYTELELPSAHNDIVADGGGRPEPRLDGMATFEFAESVWLLIVAQSFRISDSGQGYARISISAAM